MATPIIKALERVEKLQTAYLNRYEYEDGEGGGHYPSEEEQILIQDAINGLLASEGFADALTDWRLLVRKKDAEETSLEKIEVKVRESCGTYIARGGSKTASCTVDAAHAVRALAVKLWGEGKHGHACMGHMENGVQRWQIARAA